MTVKKAFLHSSWYREGCLNTLCSECKQERGGFISFYANFYWSLAESDPNRDIISKIFKINKRERSDSSGSGRCCQAWVKCSPSSSGRCDRKTQSQLSAGPFGLFVAQSRRCWFCCKDVPNSKDWEASVNTGWNHPRFGVGFQPNLESCHTPTPTPLLSSWF